ncbi:hypothetical protein H0H81_000447 [Sphagnurus paluster]|uniref:Uncharacterized protein n=1 Tax=Sphagnurus paluster TaxID=117069 RepID=A0A9P7KH24_9AGAR|nr:hypothetical protein H0H81_000447 [Sphagnurus paluster]
MDEGAKDWWLRYDDEMTFIATPTSGDPPPACPHDHDNSYGFLPSAPPVYRTHDDAQPTSALPNDYINSNSLLTSIPVRPAPPSASFLRRAARAVLPSNYLCISAKLVIGIGTNNDRVFANSSAQGYAAA